MENQPLVPILYVDDIFLTREEILIAECQRDLTSDFEMKDLGLMYYFLCLDIWQRNDERLLSISREVYCGHLVKIWHGGL